MKEIEVKILEIDEEKVIKRLEELGAEKTFDGEISDLMFDFPGNTLRKNKCSCRLRSKNKKEFLLTFKNKLSKEAVKITEETEVVVENYENMKKILLSLGLSVFREHSNQRKTYVLDETKFEIDQKQGIPVFLEIESKDTTSLKKSIELLGYGIDDAKPWTWSDLKRHYGFEV